jgi:PGF-pre-PGF domain-containing protein
MEKKVIFSILSVSVFFLIAGLSFIGASVTITSPVSGTGYSSSEIVNVSYINGTDFTDATTSIFYYSTDGVVWTPLPGAAPSCSIPAGTNTGYCGVNVTLGFSVEGAFSLDAVIFNSTGNATSSAVSNIIFDNIAPRVSFSGGNVNGGNYSGVRSLEVSVTEGVAVSSVYFNVTNSAGVQASFIQASSGSYYSTAFNSSILADGTYTITVYANDSLNNQNNTPAIQVVFDNTFPTATFSCSPSSVTAGQNVTCTCVPSDILSGINNVSTSYNSNPSTSNAGNYTPVCNFYDYAGNHNTTTANYVVTGASLPPTPPVTPPVQTNITQNNLISSIVPGNVSIISNLGSFGIKEIQIFVNTQADNVQLNFVKYNIKPSALTDKSGKVFEYLQIQTQNLLDHLNNAIVEIQVNKSWVSGNSLSNDDVSMFRYNESSNQWNELTTTYINEDAAYYYYTVQLTSFSFFSIGEKESAAELNNAANLEANQPAKDFTWIFMLVVGFVVVAIIVVAILLIKKRNST